jgi:ABC-type phosphate/phosphonate transport system substrate-binding protein
MGCALFVITSSAPRPVFAEPTGISDSVFTVGFASGIFPDADQSDVQAAMQLWTKQLALGMGIKSAPHTIIYTGAEELTAAVNRGELTIVSLPALDYLHIRRTARMSPALVSYSNSGNKRRFLLVTRRDSGIRSVRHLRNRSLLLPSRKKYSAGHIWLDVLLLREGLPDNGSFYRQTKESATSSQALMAVFFKRYDAAVITRGALETGATLNPQLRDQLTIIAESDILLGDITCIPDNVAPGLRRAIENAAEHLHESAVGKQIFTLFQMDRAIPFQPSHLAGLEALLRERDRLKARAAKKL